MESKIKDYFKNINSEIVEKRVNSWTELVELYSKRKGKYSGSIINVYRNLPVLQRRSIIPTISQFHTEKSGTLGGGFFGIIPYCVNSEYLEFEKELGSKKFYIKHRLLFHKLKDEEYYLNKN